MDKNCENCDVLRKLYGEQFDWFETLSLQNMEVLEKSSKQSKELYILKRKLREKDLATTSERMEAYAEYGFYYVNLDKPLYVLVEESKDALNEADVYKQGISRLNALFDENTTYMSKMLEFFRESYFQQLQLSSDLKCALLGKMTENSTNEHTMIINQLKEEEKKIRQIYKQHYQQFIKNLQEELRKGKKVYESVKEERNELYVKLHEAKVAKNDMAEEKYRVIESRKTFLNETKNKNKELKKQINLQAKRHQEDMENMQKKLAELTMDKTKEE